MHVTYEDLGDGQYRYTMFPHYIPLNQLIFEGKCDGGTYPIRDGNGKTTGNTLAWDAIHKNVNDKTVEELHLRFSRRDDEP
jgi:hypothetical protein